MARRKPYQEGDALLIPLQNGYGICVAARVGGANIIWGYCFVSDDRPKSTDLAALHPDDAVVRLRLGDLYVRRGRWEVLGQLPGWDRRRWPMVELRRKSGAYYAVVYDPNDPSTELASHLRPIGAEEAQRLPEDGLLGAPGVEALLQNLLNAHHQAASVPAA